MFLFSSHLSASYEKIQDGNTVFLSVRIWLHPDCGLVLVGKYNLLFMSLKSKSRHWFWERYGKKSRDWYLLVFNLNQLELGNSHLTCFTIWIIVVQSSWTQKVYSITRFSTTRTKWGVWCVLIKYHLVLFKLNTDGSGPR